MAQEITAPMAGALKEYLVAVGDSVSEGQEVVIIESMKMEIPVESTASGTVEELVAPAGEPVTEGQPLIRLA